MATSKKSPKKKTKQTTDKAKEQLKSVVLEVERIVKSAHSAREKESLIEKNVRLWKEEFGL